MEEYHLLEEKFNRAIALKDYDINDVKAARTYVEAYVTFFKMAEGEEHEHHPAHGHEHHHGHWQAIMKQTEYLKDAFPDDGGGLF